MTSPGGAPARITALGDAALTVAFAADFDRSATARVRALVDALAAGTLPGVIEAVPGYVAVTLHYDPLVIDFATLRDRLRELLAGLRSTAGGPTTGAILAVPVRYDGPDLEEVAGRTGLTPDEVVERHAAPEYEVALLGFVPGFVYLSGLDPRLVLPRRESPRTRVPAGSVAIAGAQTGIYPAATPGGWHLIGRTDLRLFDPGRDPPMALRVGDRVRFVPERA